MNVRLNHLLIRTRQTTEHLRFSDGVTFLYGPVGTGKSTVARLIDYCFGGDLERTPAIQLEFVAVTLGARLGGYDCALERGAEETQTVRVTWGRDKEGMGSVNAPLVPSQSRLVDAEVFNLSDLLFFLCGVEPIRVPQQSRNPESPMIRLSFRDIWWYCYLDQTHLDSSFFRLEDPFRGRKSQDAMRFFTGLHSERLNQLQADLYNITVEQQSSRDAVSQIRGFMKRFEFASEEEVAEQISTTETELSEAEQRKQVLESERENTLHPTDALRRKLRELSLTVSALEDAVNDSEDALAQQKSLKAELITTKIKADRSEQAGRILEGVEYERCPQCGSDITQRSVDADVCRLCVTVSTLGDTQSSIELETIRRELNDRIDQIGDAITRRTLALEHTKRQLQSTSAKKRELDNQLQHELARYDSAYVESIRLVERQIATLKERRRSLVQLSKMLNAIDELEVKAGALQGRIDLLRSSAREERGRLRAADENAQAIARHFKEIMLRVGFPGVLDSDEVVLDPRNWKPTVRHGEQEWGFWDTGSGGKKTLFNVCYALALHEVALERGMPVPTVLIIDSPTKNISDNENPALVRSLYEEVYRVAANTETQFLLIDSELVEPKAGVFGFLNRRLAGEPEAPSLISYYVGP